MDWQENPHNIEFYEVVETNEFLDQVEELIGSVQQWDEIKTTFDLDLARDPLFKKDPSVLNEIPGTDLYGMTIRCAPPLTLFYTVNEHLKRLTLIEIHPYR